MRLTHLAALGSAILTLSIAPAAAASSAGACSCPAVTSFTPPAASDGPFGITQGPGGTWYAEGDRIVRVRPNGTSDQFVLPDPESADAGWLTWDGHDHVWFADRGNDRLGSIDAHGHVAESALPASPAGGIGPGGMVIVGGAVWFTDPLGDRIGRFDPGSHRFTMFQVPTADAWPLGITLGPDGALWFVERTAGKVARMSLRGAFHEVALAPDSFPNRIIVGPDHAIWFTELDAGLIGRVTLHGTLTETPVDGGPVGIALGPDGRVYTAMFDSNQLARLDSTGRVVHTWTVPGALIVASSRGALWVTDQFADSLARVQVSCP